MEIQSGKLYENRTWKYLYPCLKAYGEDLTKGLAQFFKLAVGVGDYNREDEFDCMYVLIDTNIPLINDRQIKEYRERFSTFLSWVSYQDYYVSDYIYGKDMHMIVLKLPQRYVGAFAEFVKGKYASMYSKADIKTLFKFITSSNKELEIKQNKKIKLTRDVLYKDRSYVKTFVTDVNQRFNTEVTEEDFLEAELDYPPVKKEEIFNYKEVEEAVELP